MPFSGVPLVAVVIRFGLAARSSVSTESTRISDTRWGMVVLCVRQRLRTGIRGCESSPSARHAKAEMTAASPPGASTQLVATYSDGGGHPGVAGRSDWHQTLVFARSDVDGAYFCSASRERDPLGDSARTRGSDGEGVLHSPG